VSPSALELVLTGLSSFVGIGLGTLFFGLRRRVKTSGGRLLSTFVFYGTRVGKEMELGPARARAFAVTPDSGFVRHVVFATATGPRAFAADPEGAERLATGGIEPALAERVASPARVTSARYRSPDRPARLRS
jgi:hypothetical protein